MNAELAALAVHDLKNALGILEGQLVALEAAPSAQQARAARQHCEHLRREMVSFLTLYRGQSLRAMVDDESPLELLRSAATDATHHGAKPGIVIEIGLGPCAAAPAFWYLDIRLVRLALDAALHNACRYARQRETLDAELRQGSLVLSIDDDGPGLSSAMPGAWSTGLGHELCAAVARAHSHDGREGKVCLFDRTEGGARFELILP